MLKKIRFMIALMAFVLVTSSFVGAQTAELPPLIEPGPYGVRLTAMTFVDEHREDWKLETYIWYPADKSQATPSMPGSLILKDAPPDRSGAPYPLILYSHGWTSSFGELMEVKAHLASHGYVVAAVYHHDTNPPLHEFVDRPLDIMLALDKLAAITDGDLAGMIDTNHVGLMGYSQGAETAFQMLGLLSDPLHYTNWCAEHPDITSWDCNFVDVGATEAYRAALNLENLPDGRWGPFGDERIRAVLVMAPGDFPLTTDDSLAAVTTPTMIFHGTRDTICDYDGNAVHTYTQLGTEDRYLITLVRGSHSTYSSWTKPTQHFSTAFFGYYLKGKEELAPHLTEEQAETWHNVVWGPYTGE